MVEQILIQACVAAFLILFLARSGAREQMQIHSPKMISKVFDCDLCLSFWVNLLMSLIFFTFMDAEVSIILSVVAGCVITRKLL